MIEYKIKHPSGKFSTGTTNPKFAICGKTWTKKSYLESHLRQKYNGNLSFKTLKEFYANEKCMIVSYDLILDKRENI